jgi:hypothetical protein
VFLERNWELSSGRASDGASEVPARKRPNKMVSSRGPGWDADPGGKEINPSKREEKGGEDGGMEASLKRLGRRLA